MKNPTLPLTYLLLITIPVVTGCASSAPGMQGPSTEDTNVDTMQVDNHPTGETTMAPDSVSSSDTTTTQVTLGGSTEAERIPPSFDPNAVEVGGDTSLELADHLRQLAGVHVIGIGPNARVSVRGGAPTTILGRPSRSQPLFIVDGTEFRDYARLYNEINVFSIKNIRVLKGPEASMYGSRGGNGVIIIDLFSAGDTRD